MPGLRVSGAPFQPMRTTAGCCGAVRGALAGAAGAPLPAQPASKRIKLTQMKNRLALHDLNFVLTGYFTFEQCGHGPNMHVATLTPEKDCGNGVKICCYYTQAGIMCNNPWF